MADDNPPPSPPTIFAADAVQSGLPRGPVRRAGRSARAAARCCHDETMGSFCFTRYNDIRPLVSDRTLWRDPLHGDEEAMLQARRPRSRRRGGRGRSETTSILTLDDPDHARIRQPLAQALYARVAKFKPEVERIVAETWTAIDATGPFDLMSTFCVPIPIDVIASILGVDRGAARRIPRPGRKASSRASTRSAPTSRPRRWSAAARRSTTTSPSHRRRQRRARATT